MAFGQINNGDSGITVRNLLNAALAFKPMKKPKGWKRKGY